jgi:tryptophanyl-tRNA synthetase
MRIFSGIQPTGAKHLGNYSGGFRQYAAMQEQGEAFFCIAPTLRQVYERMGFVARPAR